MEHQATLNDIQKAPHDGWFSFEGVPLKWHLPVGLLYDLYAGADPASKGSGPASDDETAEFPLPWRLVVQFSDWPDEELVRLDADGMVMHDAFINSVKEADFMRNGTAKGIMTLSKEDSSGLWKSVQEGTLYSLRSYRPGLVIDGGSGPPLLPTHIQHPPPATEPAVPERAC
ncbi:autophagy protein 5 [Aspergillus terreus]